ncbi:MAG TPA: MFS transporter [Candidatus Binatia bacterium]|nr:MFS transporter [Candidatus Binatia bacterium]
MTVFRIAEHPSRPSRLLTHDGWVLFGTRIVRLFAYGLLSVVLALYLSAVGLSDRAIGVLLTLTLVGDAVISLLITRVADRVGRRRMLLAGAGLMILAGGIFALTSNPFLLTLVAFIGTLSPSGNEVGPFLAIEQASLAHITSSQQRTRVFAWYNLVGSFATALGALSSGILTDGLQQVGSSPLGSYRVLFATYALLGVVLALLFTALSAQIEVEPSAASHTAGFSGLHRSRTVVRGLSALFMVDSFAGGLVVQSLLAYWLHLRFGADAIVLGRLFFGVHLLAGLSALVAARIAARFGLINTMVFTHMPASIFLLLTPLMPTFSLTMTMVLLRYCVAQMDVPTRHSYLMAIVAPDERSAAAGVTTVARTAASAMAPTLTGALLGASFLSTPFFIAGGLKITYDLALYFRFRSIKPPEEQ